MKHFTKHNVSYSSHVYFTQTEKYTSEPHVLEVKNKFVCKTEQKKGKNQENERTGKHKL